MRYCFNPGLPACWFPLLSRNPNTNAPVRETVESVTVRMSAAIKPARTLPLSASNSVRLVRRLRPMFFAHRCCATIFRESTQPPPISICSRFLFLCSRNLPLLGSRLRNRRHRDCSPACGDLLISKANTRKSDTPAGHGATHQASS